MPPSSQSQTPSPQFYSSSPPSQTTMAALPPSSSDTTIPTPFEYVASEDVSKVSLVGSWDQWSNKLPMLKQPHTTTWLAQLSLPPGPVSFKFVTDDKWVIASTYDVAPDGFGGENNHRIISEPSENTRLEADRAIIPATDQTSDGRHEEPENQFDREKDNKQQDAICLIC